MGSSCFEHELPILIAWSLRINAVLSFTITCVSWTNGPKSRFNNCQRSSPSTPSLCPDTQKAYSRLKTASPSHSPPGLATWPLPPLELSHPSQKLSQAPIPRTWQDPSDWSPRTPYLVLCLLHISHRIVHCLFMCLSAPLSWILPESRGFTLVDLWYLTKSLAQSLVLRINEVSSGSRTFSYAFRTPMGQQFEYTQHIRLA